MIFFIDLIVINIIHSKMEQPDFNYNTSRSHDKNHTQSSKKRLSALKKQQSFLYDTFKIDNFYSNGKLDLLNLKSKIKLIKSKQINDPKANGENKNQILISKKEQQALKKQFNFVSLQNTIHKISKCYQFKEQKQSDFMTSKQTIQSNNPKKSSGFLNEPRNKLKSVRKQESLSKNLSKIIRQNIRTPLATGRYASLQKQFSHNSKCIEEDTLYGNFRSNLGPKIQNIGGRQSLTNRKKQLKNESYRSSLINSRLQSLSTYRKKLTKIKIQDEQQLESFHQNILSIWNLYQKLSEIVKILSRSAQQIFTDSNIFQALVKLLCEYKQLMCSSKYEFLVNIIDNCLDYNHSRAIILSRLLQNLSIVYIILEIVEKIKSDGTFQASYLVNFVGISSNNLLLMLRVITLIYVIEQQMNISEEVLGIFQTIAQFEINSFRAELTEMKDAIRRMDHNNELICIIQSKINNKMSARQYHTSCIGNFMKGVMIQKLREQIQIAGDRKFTDRKSTFNQTKPFFEYSYFIFQYLAFSLHHEKVIGLFPRQIETAPAPYLPLKKKYTIIINPLNIFLHENKSKYFIRANTDKFLSQLSEKCNIVFWSQQMPQQVDNLINLIDNNTNKIKFQTTKNGFDDTKQPNIKRLYQHHCIYDYNYKGEMVLLKDIERIGCEKGKYIILDSSIQHYYKQQQFFTILLPWKGEAKDSKLSVVLELILPLLNGNIDLSLEMKALKYKIQQLLKPKRKLKKVQPNQQIF